MTLHNEAAALGANRDSGGVDRKAVAAPFYPTSTLTVNATDIAAAIIGARFGLSECMSRVICELAGLGRGGAA